MYVYIIYHKHPDHFPSAILDISYTQLVQPLLILDYLPSFSVKTFWEKWFTKKLKRSQILLVNN